jgi:hypothetical protein
MPVLDGERRLANLVGALAGDRYIPGVLAVAIRDQLAQHRVDRVHGPVPPRRSRLNRLPRHTGRHLDRRRGTDAGGAGHAAVRRLYSSGRRRCRGAVGVRAGADFGGRSTLTTASPTPTGHWSLSSTPEPLPGCAAGCGFAADGATSRSRGWCPRRSLHAPSGPAVLVGHRRYGSGPCPHRASARSGGDRSPRGLPPPRPRARHAYAPAPAADRLCRAGCRGRGTGAHWRSRSRRARRTADREPC